ncbi:GNAT family N-acetyltransferase [Deinococcus sp.]|uniref:GNAT family N-acetyltransferase n=1 Tax=Deinococcus sp. TaxID=47478 RepID=UPI003CC5938B
MTFSLSVHDPQTLALEQRLDVARLGADVFAFANPDDPPLHVESRAAALAQDWGDERSLLVLAREADHLVGHGRLYYDLKQNTDKATLHVGVHPTWRRRGLGKQLARRLAQEALRLGRANYIAETTSRSPEGEAFAAALGAVASLPSVISELHLDRLDQELLRRWTTRPENDPYRLHRFQLVPEHELARVAGVFDVMNTAPRGELEFEDWLTTAEHVRSHQQSYAATGGETLLYVTEHLPSAEFVAFTQVGWHPLRSSVVDQWGTGVRPDHRGRGLGKWLKAAVLQDLPAHNEQARKAYTSNADVNAAMLGINRALGYAPAFSRMEWQGQTQAILDSASARA